MVNDSKVFVSTHRAAAIIFFLADDMDFTNVKRIRGADNRADIKIMFKIFDGDFERCASFFEGGKNLFVWHAFIFVD